MSIKVPSQDFVYYKNKLWQTKKNENNEDEFPGYPYYPANEDIMNAKDAKRIEVDVENLSRSKNVSPNLPDKSVPEQVENEGSVPDADK